VIRDGEVEDSRFVSHQLGFFFLIFFIFPLCPIENMLHIIIGPKLLDIEITLAQ
jgi:hypothetical protein